MPEEKIQRLSEGYDFIEESCGYMNLDYEESSVTPIIESETFGDFKVLGRAKGAFQPMGEMSRNNRLYEADHWDIQLEDLNFQNRIKSRDLLGTIGHHDKRVDDKDIAAGIVSHIVTCLEKREDKNGIPYLYGELEILGTPAGQILQKMYEGHANLYVSSRGAGKLLDVPGQAYKKVDKNNYFCETFDVVRRPGFLKAKPVFEEIPKQVHECTETEQKLIQVVHEDVKPVSEIDQLRGQVEKLAKIMEQVVESIYEVEEPKEEKKLIKVCSEEQKAALIGAVGLLLQANISEEALNNMLDVVIEGMGIK